MALEILLSCRSRWSILLDEQKATAVQLLIIGTFHGDDGDAEVPSSAPDVVFATLARWLS